MMNISKKSILGVSLAVLAFSFVATDVLAAGCTSLPDCSELGYKDTSCTGKALKCPFDQTKLFCVKKKTNGSGGDDNNDPSKCHCPSSSGPGADDQCRFPKIVGVWGDKVKTSDACGNTNACDICSWDGKYVRHIVELKHRSNGVRCEKGSDNINAQSTDNPVIVISASGWYELVDDPNTSIGSEPAGSYDMKKYSPAYTPDSVDMAKHYLELTGDYDKIKDKLVKGKNGENYFLAFETQADCENAIKEYFPDGKTVVVDVMDVPEYK